MFFQPYMVQQQLSQSSSTPNVPTSSYAASNLDERPATANRNTPDAKTPAQRVYGKSTPDTFARAQQELERKKKREAEEKDDLMKTITPSYPQSDCPPSPDDDIFRQKREEAHRIQSSSSVNSNGIISQGNSPGTLVSPISSVNLSSQEQFFPSVPSLPALVSSSSSVCADPEGDFLQHPGIVPQSQQTVLSPGHTPESLTPPTLSKQSSRDEETSTASIGEEVEIGDAVQIDVDEEGYNGDGDTTLTADDDDDDSDSDEGIMMGGRKPAKKLVIGRRGTNASAGSTETAKKVDLENPGS